MNAVVVVTVHITLLVSGILSGTLLVLNRRYVEIYSSNVLDLTDQTASLDGYSIKPDVSLAVHLALLTSSMLIPTLTGLALANTRRKLKKKSLKVIRSRLRVTHVVLLVIAVAAAGDLVFTEAAYVADVDAITCKIHANRICRCGANTAQVPLVVCLCKMFRVSYLSMLILGFVTLITSFLDATKMVKFKRKMVTEVTTKEKFTQVEVTESRPRKASVQSVKSLKEPQEHRAIFVTPNLHPPPLSARSRLHPTSRHESQSAISPVSAGEESASLSSETLSMISLPSSYEPTPNISISSPLSAR